MKIVFAVLFIVAGSYALPTSEINTKQERIVAGQIIQVIERISEGIKEAGLDPLVIERFDFERVWVPLFSEVSGFLEDVRFEGASNINVINMDYSVLLNRLRFDIALPQLSLTVGDSGIKGIIFGTEYDAGFKGSVSINQIRLAGEVRVNIGIISGISIRSLDLDFSLGGIDSNLNLVVRGSDYSDDLNTALGVTIPDFLEQYRSVINYVLERVVLAILDEIL